MGLFAERGERCLRISREAVWPPRSVHPTVFTVGESRAHSTGGRFVVEVEVVGLGESCAVCSDTNCEGKRFCMAASRAAWPRAIQDSSSNGRTWKGAGVVMPSAGVFFMFPATNARS